MQSIRRFTIVLGALCLVAMTLITTADVTMRYIANRPIFGAGEMVQLLLGVAVFSGMFAVTLDRGHVNVSLFEPFLLRHFRRGYRSIFDVMSLVGVVAVTGILGWKAIDYLHYPEETVVLKLPVLGLVAILAALSALSILAAVAAMGREHRPTPPHSPQDWSEEDAR